jgi:hypothetical protein
MADSSGNHGFGAAIEGAQSSPMDKSGRDRFDGYPTPRGTIKDGDQEVPRSAANPRVNPKTGYTDYNSTMKRQVFVIWRPVSKCDRCQANIKNNLAALPDEGDFTCPHVQTQAYEEVMNRSLDGTYALHSENESMLQDGTVIVSVKWSEPLAARQAPKDPRERQRKPPRT